MKQIRYAFCTQCTIKKGSGNSPSHQNKTHPTDLNFPCISDLLAEVTKFQHHTQLCFNCSPVLVSCSNLSPIFLLNAIFAMTILDLTLNLLTTTIVAPPSNASKWQMGFNSVFKGLISHVHLASFDISYPKLSFIAPKISLPCSQQLTTDPYSDQANPVLTLLPYFFNIHFNNIFPYTGFIFYLTSTTYHFHHHS